MRGDIQVVRGDYKQVLAHGHPKRNSSGHVREHILIAERALGRYLPEGAEVHHVNGEGKDNRSDNLVICQDHAYHMLLHMRTKTYHATGDPNKRRCRHCKEWDDPINLSYHSRQWYHLSCNRESMRKRREVSCSIQT